MSTQSTTVERHYRIAELCDLWGIGRETPRKILVDEPKVVEDPNGTASVPHHIQHPCLHSGTDTYAPGIW